MAQELLTYLELAQRLDISMAAAKGVAEGLQLPRYAAPEGKVVVLCDVSQLRGTTVNSAESESGHRARRTRDKGRHVHLDPPPYAEPLPHRPARRIDARMAAISSLHDRIDELQRQVTGVQAHDAGEAAQVTIHSLSELFGIASQATAAKQAADAARQEIAEYRSRPWWKRLSG